MKCDFSLKKVKVTERVLNARNILGAFVCMELFIYWQCDLNTQSQGCNGEHLLS